MMQNKLTHHEPGRPGWQGLVKSKHGMSTDTDLSTYKKFWKNCPLSKASPEIVGLYPNTDKEHIMTGRFFQPHLYQWQACGPPPTILSSNLHSIISFSLCICMYKLINTERFLVKVRHTFDPVEEIESRIRKIPFLSFAGKSLTLPSRNSSKS